MAPPPVTWLVTGFPAFTARALVRELVHGDDPARVHLLVPADRSAEAESFLRELRPLGSTARILEGDAVRMDLGLPGRDYVALAREVDVLASLYDVSPLPDDGTGGYGGLYGKLGEPAGLTVRAVEEALEFAAAAAPRLRQLVQLGSLTVAGDHSGVWTEEDLTAGQRHRTDAERSRHRAERLLWRARDRVPFTIVRVGTLLGDSRTGESGWYHGPHDLPELLLALPPAAAWTRVRPPAGLHAVPVDHLARVMRVVGTEPPERSGALHVAPAERLPLAQLREALEAGGGTPRLPRTLRGRLRKRWGSSAAAVARSLWRIDTPAAISTRRALDVERAAGLTQPRPADYLLHLAAHVRARVAAEARRLAEAGVEDALDA
ncbi:MAG: SDR family oxidoreductase [Deltaproteobacteria bacterium]|nr:SDR family oxidoreductase [Deltaproteobacteria bacterium]